MKFLSFLVGLTALSTAVSGYALPNSDDAIDFEASTLEKRAFLPIVGAPGATRPRFEVRQLKANNANQWTLFMLALRQIQARPDSAKNSFFQIAGIHGVPKQAWDEVGQCSTCTAAGYCPHSSILFLGWHRAYVALMEQELIKVAKNIANQYPSGTKAAMQSAAANLRLPYWDWAAHPPNGGSNMPPLLTDTQVTVNGPSGSTTFNNPLHHYVFKNPAKQQFSPWVNIKVGSTSNALVSLICD
jgi:tyrosinase